MKYDDWRPPDPDYAICPKCKRLTEHEYKDTSGNCQGEECWGECNHCGEMIKPHQMEDLINHFKESK